MHVIQGKEAPMPANNTAHTHARVRVQTDKHK